MIKCGIIEFLATQSPICGPAAHSSSWILLGMQNLIPYPRTIESESALSNRRSGGTHFREGGTSDLKAKGQVGCFEVMCLAPRTCLTQKEQQVQRPGGRRECAWRPEGVEDLTNTGNMLTQGKRELTKVIVKHAVTWFCLDPGLKKLVLEHLNTE